MKRGSNNKAVIPKCDVQMFSKADNMAIPLRNPAEKAVAPDIFTNTSIGTPKIDIWTLLYIHDTGSRLGRQQKQ